MHTRKLKLGLLGLLLLSLTVFTGAASAQTVQFTDNFTRTNSTTVGSGWVDTGAAYKVNSNTLQTQATVTQGVAGSSLLRPVGEALQDTQIEVDGEAWASTKNEIYKGEMRVQGSGNSYDVEMDYGFGASGASLAVKTHEGSTDAVIASGTAVFTFTPVAGHFYKAVLKATGVSPTTLVVSVLDGGVSGTGTTPVTGTGGTYTDSTTDLQASGRQGVLLGWYDQTNGVSTGTPVLAAFTSYTFGSTAATSYTQSLSAAAGPVGTPITITYTPNGTTTAVVTPAVSGIAGTFSPTTITLTNTAPVTASFTPTGAGAGTITATNSGTLTNPGSAAFTATVSSVYIMGSATLKSYFQQFATYINGSSYAQWDSPGNYTLPLTFTGTSILVAFDTTPETGASLAAGSYPLLKYSVDNQAWVTYRLTSKLTLTGLANTTHTLQIAYVLNTESIDIWTTPVGVVRFTQITLDSGATLSAATVPTKTMCWHGDSTGRSAWNDYAAYSDADGTFTAGYLAAQGLGAFFGNCSFSRQGWSQGGPTGSNVPAFYTAGNNAATTYNQYVNGVFRTVGSGGTGLFILDCDYHLICQGQNGGTSSSQVQAFLGDYRTHTVNYIFLVVPYSGANRAAITAGFNAYQAATPDAKCFLIDTATDAYYSPNPSKFSGDGVHPNQWSHAQLASMIVKAIQSKLGGTSSVVKRRVQ